MKSQSFRILSLTALLVVAPALQAHDADNSSWHAPFTTSTFLYPALGLAASYVLYKIYCNATNSSDLTVMAPWQPENNTIEEQTSLDAATPDTTKMDELTMDAVHEIIQSGINLFVEASGPELVTAHVELSSPDLSEEARRELEHKISCLEAEAPPFAETIPSLMIYMSMLTVLEDELMAQGTVNKSLITSEYMATLETIDTLMFFIGGFIEIYGGDMKATVRA